MRRLALLTSLAFAVTGCQSAPATPATVAAASAAPSAAPGPATSVAAGHDLTRATGVLFGRLNLPAAVVASGGGNLLSTNGGNVIAAGAGNVIAQGAGNVIAQGAGNIIASGGGNVIAQGAGNVIAQGAGNVIAQGAGNVIAQGAGNYKLLRALEAVDQATAPGQDEVIDALALKPSSEVTPLVDPKAAHPVANVLVALTDARGNRLPNTPLAVTSKTGFYYFVGVPAEKHFVVTAPFLPSKQMASVIASGGGNVIASGGGNVIAQGAGNVIAQGAGNVIAQGAGNYGLLDTSGTTAGASSPKVLANPLPSSKILGDAKTLEDLEKAVLQQLADGTLTRQQAAGVVNAAVNLAGDISVASTVTAGLLLQGKEGELGDFDSVAFNQVVTKIDEALKPAALNLLEQEVPVVPSILDTNKLAIPLDTLTTFNAQDKKVSDLQAEVARKEEELSHLSGQAKADAQKALDATRQQLADALQTRLQSLLDVATKLQQTFEIPITTTVTGNPTDTTETQHQQDPTTVEDDGLPDANQVLPDPDVAATGAFDIHNGNVVNQGPATIL